MGANVFSLGGCGQALTRLLQPNAKSELQMQHNRHMMDGQRAFAELEVESVLSEGGFGVNFLPELQIGPGKQD